VAMFGGGRTQEGSPSSSSFCWIIKKLWWCQMLVVCILF
jgi:hypothetical protein